MRTTGTRPRSFVWALLAAVWGALLVDAAPPPEAADERPHFVCLLADDLGYGDLGCYGSRTIRTPRLDRLASEGLRLERCYAAAPVCSPSRAGLLTGRVPSRVGVYDWIPAGSPMHLARDEITVASLLRKAGYATCHVGKWHLNGEFNSSEQPQPGDHGFQHWFSTQNNASPSHENPKNFVRNGKAMGPLEGYSCQLVADEAIRWLRSGRDPMKPFFLFVCFHEPHEPVASPPELVADYPDATERGEALYYANVTNLDRAVGRIVDALDAGGLAERTLVLFTSDNGPETLNRYRGAWRSHGSPGPLRGMKLHLYEGGIRVPGILRWKGRIEPGTTSREPVSGVDVLPTLCRLAGVEPPADRVLDGASFHPVLEGGKVPRERPLFWHYYRSIGLPKAAMLAGDAKILGHWDGPELPAGAGLKPGDSSLIRSRKLLGFEMYDLGTDAAETRDLGEIEEERARMLFDSLKRRYEEVVAEGRSWGPSEP